MTAAPEPEYDDIWDSLFHNADLRIMPLEPQLLDSAAHLACPLI